MNEVTRLLVLNLLTKAHDAALSVLRPYLDEAPEPVQTEVLRSIEAFRGCLLGRYHQDASPEDLTHYLKAVMIAQSDPVCLGLLKQYAEYLNYFLTYSRDRLFQPEPRKDN